MFSQYDSKKFAWPRLIAVAALLILCLSFIPGTAEANPRYASIVVDAQTGQILHERHADRVLHPASTAKLMTLLLTFEALESGKISLRDRVHISRHAHNMVPSKLDLGVGATIRVEDAIYALVTKSANDVAAALAEHIGGTESNFAVMMTNKARQLGMNRTHFMNASGLHNPRQVTTVRDMTKLARALIYQHPKYYKYFSTRSFTYQGRTYRNHNRLMETYAGMDGMKTGYIGASGFNLVATAKRGDRRLIAVVFGGRTSQSRNAHLAGLLDGAFGTRASGVQVAANNATTPAKAGRDVPVPMRKPEALLALAQAPSAQSADPLHSLSGASLAEETARLAALAPTWQSRALSRLIGEGDSDPAAIRRLEAGYMAMSAMKGEVPGELIRAAALASESVQASETPQVQLASLDMSAAANVLRAPAQADSTEVQAADKSWSVQIGAFSSRVKTDAALQASLKKLPAALRGGTPVIAPLRAGDGWLFRGRLNGYSEQQARQVCARLPECLPVGPHAQQ